MGQVIARQNAEQAMPLSDEADSVSEILLPRSGQSNSSFFKYSFAPSASTSRLMAFKRIP